MIEQDFRKYQTFRKEIIQFVKMTFSFDASHEHVIVKTSMIFFQKGSVFENTSLHYSLKSIAPNEIRPDTVFIQPDFIINALNANID